MECAASEAAARRLFDWSDTVSSWSWVIVALGLIAAIIAVQFDEPWLEISGAAAFVLLFAWVVVALRVHTGSFVPLERRNFFDADEVGTTVTIGQNTGFRGGGVVRGGNGNDHSGTTDRPLGAARPRRGRRSRRQRRPGPRPPDAVGHAPAGRLPRPLRSPLARR